MQALYKEKLELSLGYEQHAYVIMGTINKSFQHVFINQNHCYLIKIYTSTPNSHCKVYDSNILPWTKTLPHDIIQLFKQLTNVEQSFYKYAKFIIMQQISHLGLIKKIPSIYYHS